MARLLGEVSHLEGYREARETLNELGKSATRTVGRRTLKVGAAIMAERVKARAPVSSDPNNKSPGSLKASITVKSTRASKGRPRIAVLAVDAAAVPNEFGTSKMHARPFFRPAVDGAREAIAAAVGAALKVEVDRAAKRAARRGAKK